MPLLFHLRGSSAHRHTHSARDLAQDARILLVYTNSVKEWCFSTDFSLLRKKIKPKSESDDVSDSIGASIICGTPGRFVKAIKSGRLEMSKVDVLVLDEADLLFGFGHEQLLREFIQHLPGMVINSVSVIAS